jgi:VCBS repeat-containing protein
MIIWGGNADQAGITHTGSIYYPTAFTNNPPAVTDDAYDALENDTLLVAAPGLLANDNDPDGDPITAVLAAAPTNGSVALNHDGSFSYTPDPGFFGEDTFTYKASDGLAHSAAATVTITVEEGPNSAPTAVNDDYTMQQDETLTVSAPGVLDNDSDPDGDPLTAVLETNPANGTVTLNPDGSFTYTPDTGFSGQDTFTYQAYDGLDHSSPATVTITVELVPPGEQYRVFTPVVIKP